MLSFRHIGRAAQLRDSYISVSNYVHGRHCHPLPSIRRNLASEAASPNIELSGASEGEIPPGDGQQAATVPLSNKDNACPLSDYKKIFDLPSATVDWNRVRDRLNRKCTMHGYITSARRGAKKIDFVDFVDPQLRNRLQLVVDEDIVGQEAREEIRRLRPHSPVAVSGRLLMQESAKKNSDSEEGPPAGSETEKVSIIYQSSPPATPKRKEGPKEFQNNSYVGQVALTRHIEMVVNSIRPLNHFPQDIVAQVDTNFSPSQRHLQLRTNSDLRKTLQVRSKAQTECRKYLFMKGFDEIETPILFKSTAEGAREFLVPTRRKGLAYALPQSPQQFKQILMASGVSRYFQFARCFRDEDMRADRQPEFTQLDIEMSFASALDIMKITETLIQVLWQTFFNNDIFASDSQNPAHYQTRNIPRDARLRFPRITYDNAMRLWGSDKPDTRLGSQIYQVQDFLDPLFKSQVSPLKDPVIDIMRVRATPNPRKTRDFISSFMDSSVGVAYLNNPHGTPGIFILDPSKHMSGLSALGHEAGEKVMQLFHPQRGDLLILQARPDQAFLGENSTMMGNLRRDLHLALVSQGIINKPRFDQFLWVTDFPLFSPTNGTDLGQGGKAGLKSTHHPFTAPKEMLDVDKMRTQPLSCTGDHFDLVINGVEVGGGSRRIHDSKVQEMVLKDILEVPEKQVEEFRPLLEALRAGCPPHAGIALGFDRLMAIIRRASSVRDVIAFPKSSSGEDRMVGAPSSIGLQRWAEYHMMVEGGQDNTHLTKGEDEVTPRSEEVERELRSAANTTNQMPGPAQPDEGDISPGAPS